VAELKYYLIRRVITFLPTVVGMLFLVFLVSHIVPGDPARLWAGPEKAVKPEVLEKIRRQYYLDKPWYVAFCYYMRDVFTGNWGKSPVTNRKIIDDIKTYFPATAELAIVSELLIIAVGVPFGIVSALKRDSIIDHVARVFSLIGTSLPIFLTAIFFQYVFYFKLRLVPLGGRGVKPEVVRTGLYILDSLLCGDWHALLENLKTIILPALALSMLGMGIVTRITRSSMLDALGSDFVDYAKMKGLPNRWVIYRHALKNALVPVVTVLGLQFGGLLSGAVITETVFARPGVGRYAVQAAYSLDYPAIIGVTLLIGLVYIFANLVVDILYAWIDPRVRL